MSEPSPYQKALRAIRGYDDADTIPGLVQRVADEINISFYRTELIREP